jgi:hypothetical protein
MALVPPFRQERTSQATTPEAQARVVDQAQAQTAAIARALNASDAASTRILEETQVHSWPTTLVGAGVAYPATPIGRAQSKRTLKAGSIVFQSLMSSGANYRTFTVYRYRDGVQRGVLCSARTQSPGVSADVPFVLTLGDDPVCEEGDSISLEAAISGAAAAVPAGVLSLLWKVSK